MADPARRRHLQVAHVADLTCIHCQEKDAELERKTTIIQTLQRELNEAMSDLAGMTVAARQAGKAVQAAKAQRTKQAKEEARLEHIEAVVAHWRMLRPRTGDEFGEAGTKSFDIIEKAVKIMANDPAGPVAACCEAIDGLHLMPWEAYGKRYAHPGPGRTRRVELRHALGDDDAIAKCRAILRWVRADGAERAWEHYRAALEWEQVCRAELLDLLGERRFRRVEPAEWASYADVDGIKTNVGGSDGD